MIVVGENLFTIETTVTFNNLVCFSGYAFRVRAKTGAGAGPWNEDTTFGTSLTGTTYMKSLECPSANM